MKITHLNQFREKQIQQKPFFRFLIEKEHIQKNIADDLKHPKVVIKPPRILSKLEYRALRDAARTDRRTYAIIETMLQTGVTISELAEMRLEHVILSPQNGNLFIPAKNTRHARNIPLNEAAIEALSTYINDERPKIEQSIHVFITKTGNPMLVRNIRSTIQRYYEMAGVENAKVNDLRHTFVAHHLKRGANLLQVSKVAGHMRVSTTERYLQYIEKETEEERTELGVL